MSATWYPVINSRICVECRTCVSECSEDVIVLRGTHPVVMKPESCPRGCHVCGDICPSIAIKYVGETPNEGCNNPRCCNN